MDRAAHWGVLHAGPFKYLPAYVPAPIEVLGRFASGAVEARMLAHAEATHKSDNAAQYALGNSQQHGEESKSHRPYVSLTAASAGVGVGAGAFSSFSSSFHIHSDAARTSTQLHRAVRCYMTVETLELTPDLLGLCGDERILITAALQATAATASSDANATVRNSISPGAPGGSGNGNGGKLSRSIHGRNQPVCLGEMIANDQADWRYLAELPLPFAQPAGAEAEALGGSSGSQYRHHHHHSHGSSSSSSSNYQTEYRFAKETPHSISFALSGATYAYDTNTSNTATASSGIGGHTSSYRFTELCVGRLQALPTKQHVHAHARMHGTSSGGGAISAVIGSPADSSKGSAVDSRATSVRDGDDNDSDSESGTGDGGKGKGRGRHDESSDDELDAAAGTVSGTGISPRRSSLIGRTHRHGSISNAVRAQFQLGGVGTSSDFKAGRMRGGSSGSRGQEERKLDSEREREHEYDRSAASSRRSSKSQVSQHSAQQQQQPLGRASPPVPEGFSTAPAFEYLQRQQLQQHQIQVPLLVSGTYEVPLYTEPTSITINQRASSSIHMATNGHDDGLGDMYSLTDGVLVGRLIVKVVVIDDAGEGDLDIPLTSYDSHPTDANDARDREQTNEDIENTLRHYAHSLLGTLRTSNNASQHVHVHAHAHTKSTSSQVAHGSVNTSSNSNITAAALAAAAAGSTTIAGSHSTYLRVPPLPAWVESEALVGQGLAPTNAAGSSMNSSNSHGSAGGAGNGGSGIGSVRGRGAGKLLQQTMNRQTISKPQTSLLSINTSNIANNTKNDDPWNAEYNGGDVDDSSSDASSTIEVQVNRSFYHYVGVAEAVSCLAACAARVSILKSHAAQLERSARLDAANFSSVRNGGNSNSSSSNSGSLGSQFPIQQHIEHTRQEIQTIMNVIMNLCCRLSQPSLCDTTSFIALGDAISATGGSSALWAFFHHTLGSQNMQYMIDIAASRNKRSANGNHINGDSSVLDDLSLLIHADNHAILRASCWAIAVLASNGYIDRRQSSLTPGSSSTSASDSSAAIAEDLLHTILGYTSEMVVSLLRERTNVDRNTNPIPIYAAHIQLYNSHISQLLCAALECSNILVPCVGAVGYEVASCVNNIIVGLVAVYAPATTGASGTSSNDTSGPSADLVSAMSAMTLFLSKLLLVQPTGLDNFALPVEFAAPAADTSTGDFFGTSRVNTIGTDYGVLVRNSGGAKGGTDSRGNRQYSTTNSIADGSQKSSTAAYSTVTTSTLISTSIRRWCIYLHAIARAPAGLNSHLLLPLQDLISVIKNLLCQKLISGTTAGTVLAGIGTSTGAGSGADTGGSDAGVDPDMLRSMLPPAPRRRSRAPPASVAGAAVATGTADSTALPPPPPVPGSGSEVDVAYGLYAKQKMKQHMPYAANAVTAGSNSSSVGGEPLVPIMLGVDHVSHASTLADMNTSSNAGGNKTAGPVVMAVRSVVDSISTTPTAATSTATTSSSNTATSVSHHPLFDQQAIVYVGEHIAFLTAYTAGQDAISCMTNSLFSSVGKNGREEYGPFNGPMGADDEEEEEDVAVSTFKAAKWARRLIGSANNIRYLLARTLTAATQCNMHPVLSVTSHAGDGAHGSSLHLDAGSLKAHKTHAHVFKMLAHTFHTFSSSTGVSGTHFIPLLFHVSQSLRTSWHAIKHLPRVTPLTELLATATNANENADVNGEDASVPATPASASTGGGRSLHMHACMYAAFI